MTTQRPFREQTMRWFQLGDELDEDRITTEYEKERRHFFVEPVVVLVGIAAVLAALYWFLI